MSTRSTVTSQKGDRRSLVHLSRFFILVLVFLTIAPSYSHGVEPEGPPRPECDTLSGATRAKLPLMRTAILDVGMYVGLMVLWPHAFLPTEGSRAQFRESWTQPPYMNGSRIFFELDDDPWVINTVLHGLYGSEVYLAGRTYGHNGFVSFLYAVFASFTWEYLVESWFQRPSGIDLAWTPFAGAVIGELRYQLIRLILRGVSTRVLRNILVTIIDPLGQMERAIMGCRLNCGD
ncbi:MAG: DUF3943 domain-containing protein [Deltaproteobacteria bacterium]|nr:DUF3943 domain-containing protein [Deltaproteobacteria bacterium]